MKHVIKLAKAIPWLLLIRLSFKGICLLGVATVTILLFVLRFISNDKEERWTGEIPGERITRPDQPLYGPHNN